MNDVAINLARLMKTIYLLLAIAGTVLPLSQFYGFLTVYGLDVEQFFALLFVNKISSFFAMDVFVSAVVTALFIAYEGQRSNMRNYWFCYVALFLAGVSSGLPLFLYLREAQRKGE